MPVDVTTIKTMDKSELYNYRWHEGILQKIIIFLKENPKKAFTPHEITHELNNKYDANEFYKKIRKNSVNQALHKYKKTGINRNVKCKGIYYWYEKNK